MPTESGRRVSAPRVADTFDGTPRGRLDLNVYLSMVRDFPLVSIRTDDQLKKATEILHRMLREDLGPGEREYFDALTDLVESYERQTHPVPEAPVADILRHLMDANDLTQSDLAREVGIAQPTLSAILGGKKKPTRDQIAALAKRFNVSPAAFLPAV